jgi:hypothetical protein
MRDLALVIDRWPTLREHLRKAIILLVSSETPELPADDASSA